ncbi:hypothetical protein ITP53_30125 [Nonomuraea sp. K274]|uniref:Uncharacterized protein n=1 Tax=Nonomuraea cypriaca TaxID=1187855 RepID=A0A931AGW1_9ACTN|nr:hypothetical protein [Nonomuraea cypriaca]MBF8189910.1 hypothetical protein [Nonomuraea cypriaca]
MNVTYEHYPELHQLIERLRPEQAEEVRNHVLRLVEPQRGGLLGTVDGPDDDLGTWRTA